MPTNTMVALKSTTVTGSVASSVTLDLTGITGYTDLVLISSAQRGTSGSGEASFLITFNGDTTSGLYSSTLLYETPGSTRSSGANNIGLVGSAGDGGFLTNTINFMNYTNTSVYKTVLGRFGYGQTNQLVRASVGLWRNFNAITSITMTPANGFAIGSTFNLYGITAAAAVTSAKATGGTITYAADGYTYHAFTSSGTFTPSTNLSCDVLVVAGGGAGGTRFGGGGGAGGVSFQSGRSASSGTGYTVTIGAGGSATANTGNSGSNSVFDTITSNGGGGGGSNRATNAGVTGGSGGGASYGAGASANQGNTGGATGYGFGGGNAGTYFSGSGGGGAGSVGADSVSASVAGNGGAGLNTWAQWLSATSLGVGGYIAGGGGGGLNNPGTPGTATGGGGAGSQGTATATAGTANTGGGGGGGGYSGTSDGNGASGGSGLVIVRYLS